MSVTRQRLPLIAIPDFVLGASIWERLIPKFPQMIVAEAPDPTDREPPSDLVERMASTWASMRIVREHHSVILACFGPTTSLVLETLPVLLQRGVNVAAVLSVSGQRHEHRWPFRERIALHFAPWRSDRAIIAFLRHRVMNELEAMAVIDQRITKTLDSMNASSARRYRWFARNLSSWKRSRASRACSTTIFHLNGRRDPISPPPSVDDATLLLGGQHYIPWTFPDQVERWMSAIAADLALRFANAPSVSSQTDQQ